MWPNWPYLQQREITAPENASPEELVLFVLEGLRAIQHSPSESYRRKSGLSQALRRKLPFTPEQVFEMVRIASSPRVDFPYRGILHAAGQVPRSPELVTALRELARCIDSYYLGAANAKAILDRVNALTASGPVPAKPAPSAHGPWSRTVLTEVRERPDAFAWFQAFQHALEIKGSEPSAKWKAAAAELVASIGLQTFQDAALRWLALGPSPDLPGVQLDAKESELIRGFVWLLPFASAPGLTEAIARFAEGCLKKIPMVGAVSQKAGNACVKSIAAIGTREAVAQLTRLARRVKYDTAQRLIEEALAEAAAAANITRDELEEISIPEVDFTDDSPKARKERLALLAAHRVRVERLLLTQRAIPFARWLECYRNQPLLADVVSRLIWDFDTPAGRSLAFCWEGRIADIAGRELELGADTQVRLWHPIGSDVQTVLSWRCWLEDRKISQPFKQAHREIYILTPAERETHLHSNRFAGHILRQHQFQALCEQRRWKFRLLGAFDSHNTPALQLPEFNLSAEFDVEFPHDEQTSAHGIYLYLETGALRFLDSQQSPVPLEQVPATVFSEVLRDLDLFTGVASAGTSPQPSPEFPQYWQRYSFGDLSETAESRRDVLSRLIPKLAIASRCSLDAKFLVVRGDRFTYRIHLGSGNVLIEPGSRYLCVVPGGSSKSRSVALPFEGDETLSVILSKAFLLANDSHIRDATILQQLNAYQSPG